MYPLYLGGSPNQPVFKIPHDNHVAMHRFFKKLELDWRGAKGACVRDVWAALTKKQRRTLVKQGMREAGIPESQINQYIDAVMDGDTPGQSKSAVRDYGDVVDVTPNKGPGRATGAEAADLEAAQARLRKLMGAASIFAAVGLMVDIARAAEDGRADPTAVAKQMLHVRINGCKPEDEIEVRNAIAKYFLDVFRDAPDEFKAGGLLAIYQADLSPDSWNIPSAPQNVQKR